MGPLDMIKISKMREQFCENHPKFVAFLSYVSRRGMKEGTVLEVKVMFPDEEPVTTNIRVTASDIELINKLSEMAKQ